MSTPLSPIDQHTIRRRATGLRVCRCLGDQVKRKGVGQ
jgi:hypothetical protein